MIDFWIIFSQEEVDRISLPFSMSLVLIGRGGLVERNNATALPSIVLLPVADIFLDQCLIETNDSLKQANGLLTIVDFSSCELIHWGVVGLELAGLEEWDGILD